MHDPKPTEALASIQAARENVGVYDYPFGYDLFYGAVCGLLVAGQGLPRPWSFLALVVSFAGLAIMVHWWRSRMGWWVSGYSPRRARWVAIGLAATLIALMGGTLYGRYVGPEWLYLVTGGLGFIAAIVGGRMWLAVWRKELAETAR